jgi:uncharacterized protein
MPLDLAVPEIKPVRAEPVAEDQRIIALDVLRGVAVLGILVMNIQAFSMIRAAYLNPTALGNLEGANYWVWLLSHLLADLKFLTIFALLFGAGIVLMSDRQKAAGRPSVGLHYRRMAWLAVIGLVHAYLFWWGDILFMYALCGMVVYPLRRLPGWVLLPLGLILLGIGSAFFLFLGWTTPFWPPEAIQSIRLKCQPPAEAIAAEIEAWRGGWAAELALQAPVTLRMHLTAFPFYILWRVAGLMLLGMVLYRMGLIAARFSRLTYLLLGLMGLAIGLPIILYGVHRQFAMNWEAPYSFFWGTQFNYWGSLLISLMWITLVMLVCKTPGLQSWTRPLAAVGRMALTNYLLQTLICTTLFFGHGFGLFGQVERVGQIGIVFAIWVFQLFLSTWWLARFRFGPMEWLWRSLT